MSVTITVNEFDWDKGTFRKLFDTRLIDSLTPEERTHLDETLVRAAFREAQRNGITVIRAERIIWSDWPGDSAGIRNTPHRMAEVRMIGAAEPQIESDLVRDLGIELARTSVVGPTGMFNPYQVAEQAIHFLRQRGKLG